VGLSLIAGPARAGKIALLLERYLDAVDRGPVLIVPNRSDVDRVERDLLSRSPALLGGTIGTFDDVFARIAYGGRWASICTMALEAQLLPPPLPVSVEIGTPGNGNPVDCTGLPSATSVRTSAHSGVVP